MKLYLLRRDIDKRDPIYDCFDGHVIRADSEAMARELAACAAADEGRDVWTDPTRSACDQISEHGAPGIVLSNFNAG